MVGVEEPDLARLIGRLEGTAHDVHDVGGQDNRVSVLRVKTQEVVNFDHEMSFLLHFADGRSLNGFTSVDVSRGKRPIAFARVDGTAAEDKFPGDGAEGNGHEFGIFIVNKPARWAGRTLAPRVDPNDKERGTLWAVVHGRTADWLRSQTLEPAGQADLFES